jgi:Fungal specific transcription factor domain
LQRAIREEFIFQFSILSTFNSNCFKGDEAFLDIQRLLEQIQQSEEENSPNNRLGLYSLSIALQLFDYVFKLSYLRWHLPLSGWQLSEAEAILASLQRNWLALCGLSKSTIPPGAVLMVELFRCACLIVALKILNPELTPDHDVVRQHVGFGINLLDSIPDNRLKDTSLLIWPVFVLGIAATTCEEENSCLRPLQYLFNVCGIGSMGAVIDILAQAWSHVGSKNKRLGLDVLFRPDLLSEVMF